MTCKPHIAAVTLLLIAWVVPANATDQDVQQWTTAKLTHRFDQRFSLRLTTRMRFNDDISVAQDLLVRPALGFQPVPKLTLWFGYDRLQKFPSGTSSENRTWQAVELRSQFHALTLRNRFRLGERFVQGVSGVVVRARYRLRLSHPLWSGPWYVVGWNQVFFNLNNRGEGPVAGFEQNRLGVALGRRLGTHLRAEVGYQWRFQRKRDSPEQNDYIFMLTFAWHTRPHCYGLQLVWIGC